MTPVRRALVVFALALPACAHRDAREKPAHLNRSAESRTVALSSDPTALAQALAVPAESLRAAGEERYGRAEYDSARMIWQAEVVRAQRDQDHPGEARARMWIGLAAWHLGDFGAARHEGEASLDMKRRLGLDVELSRSYNALGLLAWHEGRHREALLRFDSAVATARRNGDAAGVARARANIPLVRVELGDFEGARRGFQATLAAGDATDDRLHGNALANLAMLEIRLGRFSRAIPLLTRARAHYAVIGYVTGEANALGQLATAWSGLGDIQRAIATVDSALAIARSHGLQQELASDLEVIADLYEQAGNARLALRSLAEADSVDAALGLAVEHASNLRRIASILLELDEVDASVQRARQALSQHQELDARAEAVYDGLQLAQSLSRRGDSVAARAAMSAARRDALRSGNPSAVRDAAAVAASLALDAGDPQSALDILSAPAAQSDLVNDWRLADLRCRASLALGRLEEARREGERAVALLERERASLGVGPLRSTYLANRVAPFSHLIAVHLALGNTASAFRVAASVPGRELAERLGGVSDASPAMASLVDGERLLLQAATLEQQIDTLSRDARSSEQRSALEHALDATRGAYADQLARHASSADARVLNTASVDATEVQSRLAANEALLTFVSGPDRIDLFIVRRHALVHGSAPIGERALASRIRVVREALRSGQATPEALAALGEMYELLLAPAIASGALDSVVRLSVVPHGLLSALPFAALWNSKTGRFLVEDRVIRYLPSAGAVTASDDRWSSDTHQLELFAPLPDSLPGSAEEVRAIASLLPSARANFGRAAGEAQVRAALRDGRSIHIASHGHYSASNPLFSGMIVGSRHETADGADDGRLEVHEILGLHTSSPLVFLSGCETGLGTGDGPFATGGEGGSLAQAFLASGARSVVATLWPVDDAEATAIATGFYRQSMRGLQPDEALARAQRDALTRDRRGALTWAAYTVFSLQSANGVGVSVKRE